MLATVPSAAVMGLEVRRVRVEVSITRGTPMIQIVGLAESAVREGRERIRAAAAQLGIHVPGLRITVNLAPAALRKGGAAFDLPIVAGILAAAGQLPAARASRWAMVGELGLDGSLRSVRGVLPIALHAAARGDVAGLLVPLDNLREARAAAGLEVRGVRTLVEALDFFRGERSLPAPGDLPGNPDEPAGREVRTARPVGSPGDLAAVRGQARAKRALLVAAAGGHNLLLRGAPGAGKTTLARCLPAILPPMTLAEAVEVTAVHSVAGRLPEGAGLLRKRPFRAPHHTISEVGLVGGGSSPRPGEVSLAHQGALFLDELPEFGRHALDVLRQPLEERVVHIVRARYSATFPARFLLVAAMNPCPCGYLTEGDERCVCDPGAVRRYLARLSGPLLDRIDMHLDVASVRWKELRGEPAPAVGAGETETARDRVIEGRERAARRLGRSSEGGAPGLPKTLGGGSGEGPPACNAEMSPKEIRRHCRIDGRAEALLRRAVERYGLSARGYHRVLKLARTIADLRGRDALSADDVAEALQYRVLDRRDGAP